jgi:hypothetical protein
MFDFLRNTKPTLPPASQRSAELAQTSTQQHTDIQRELICVVLKETLRLHGVPAGWLTCGVVVLPRRSGDEDLIIQLIVLKWNETLIRCVQVLEKALLQGLDRFDPSVNHSRYIVSWRFAPSCGCPLSQMPEPQVWTQSEPVPAPPTIVPILDRRQSVRSPPRPKFDLLPSERDFRHNDFAATVPIGLHRKSE